MIYRKDRDNGQIGGGVMIAVRKELDSEPIANNKDKNIETIYCRIKTKDKKEIILGSVYRPPKPDIETSKAICEELVNLKAEHDMAHFWIAGDFNLPDIAWSEGYCKRNNQINSLFMDTITNLGWAQVVEYATHKGNTLDLFFTNNPGLISKQNLIPGLGDHDAVLITSRLAPHRKKKAPRKIYLRNKSEIAAMTTEMKKFTTTFMQEHTEKSDVNKMWKCIKEELKRIMDKFVPTKLTTRNFQQPWFNSETKKLIRRKKRWFKRMKSSKCDRVKEKYMKIKKECQQTCRQAHSEHMKTMFDDDKHNKKLWTYIKSKNQEQTGIPDLKHNDKTIQDPT